MIRESFFKRAVALFLCGQCVIFPPKDTVVTPNACLWMVGGARGPGKNPRRCRENVQLPYRLAPGPQGIPTMTLLL